MADGPMGFVTPRQPVRPQAWSRWRGGTTAFGPGARVAITAPLVLVCAVLARAARIDLGAGYWVGVMVNAVWLIPAMAFSLWVLREVWAPHHVS